MEKQIIELAPLLEKSGLVEAAIHVSKMGCSAVISVTKRDGIKYCQGFESKSKFYCFSCNIRKALTLLAALEAEESIMLGEENNDS